MDDAVRLLYPTTAHQDWVQFMTESDALAGRLATGLSLYGTKDTDANPKVEKVLLYDAMGYVNLAALSNFGPRGGEHAQHPPSGAERNILSIVQGVGGDAI